MRVAARLADDSWLSATYQGSGQRDSQLYLQQSAAFGCEDRLVPGSTITTLSSCLLPVDVSVAVGREIWGWAWGVGGGEEKTS
jgi:hypothetical protein